VARALVRPAGLVLSLALVVVFAGSAGSAYAAVAAPEQVSALGAFDSSSNKSVTVSCPNGKQVTGGGGGMPFLTGQVVLRQVRPNAALTSVTVQGAEDQNGQAAGWAVNAMAICATPPGGLQRVSATSPSDSSNKSVTAACPAGKRLLGTGAELAGGGGQVALNDIIPGSGLQSVTVRALEDEDGTAATWSLTAHAICSNPVAGRERVVAMSPTDSSNKTVTATCPAGTRLTGVGGELAGGGGEVVLDGLFPSPALTRVEVLASEDDDGTAGNWSVRAFAICAAASERVVAMSENDSDRLKQVSADCPADKMGFPGVGADITGGAGQVRISRLGAGVEGAFVEAVEDDSGQPNSWFLRGYSICTTPFGGTSFQSISPSDSSSNKSATVTCPSGRRVLGAYGGVFPEGFPSAEGPVLNGVIPNAALTSVTATAFEDEDGTASNWEVGAEAFCATPPPGLQLFSAEGDPDSEPASGVTATCPSGKNLLGTGAEIEGGLGQVVLDDLRPNALLTTVTVTGLEDETGYANDWFLRAHAICANA
jgi:hypothetical protein